MAKKRRILKKLEQNVIAEADKPKSLSAQLLDQVQTEYQIAWTFMRPKIREGLKRLKLYNNQKRDKDRVGDPLLFTLHQTVLAALYDDKLSVEFGGREEGDEDIAENLNAVAEVDYDDMWKGMHDYELDFDALAHGRGLSYFNEYDFDTHTPIPVIWDPLTFLRDPDARSVHGNRLGQGAMRFGGREVTLSVDDMQKNEEYFSLDGLGGGGVADSFTLAFEARQARSQAQGTENIRVLQSIKGQEVVLQWMTIFKGRKILVELAQDRKKIIRVHEFEDQKWPLIDRPAYPMSHDWDGVSVWDIAEDKQRYRAALINVYGDSAKADLYPMYLYDTTKLRKSIDKNFGFNKWIPVDGPVGDAARPLIKSQPSGQSQFVLDFLDTSAQKALATPQISQGVPESEKRTLGELELVASKVDVRQSLTAKLWGFSEKTFWSRWYEIYERDAPSTLMKKSARIVGAFGPQWRYFNRENLITSNSLGPDIKIESKVLSEARKMRNFQMINAYGKIIAGDPEADMRYFKRKAGRLLFTKDEVDRMLPPTVDEMKAREENKEINEGRVPRAMIDDDHVAHLREHAAAKEGPAKDAHIKMHRFFLMQKRTNPELFPQVPSDMTGEATIQGMSRVAQQPARSLVPVGAPPEGTSTP